MKVFGGLDFRVRVSLMRRGYKINKFKKKKKRSRRKSWVVFWRLWFLGESKRRRERKLGK